MNTLFATTFCPQVATKVFWIKTNRLLAWSLIFSPLIQLAAGMRFMTGLWIDLAILAAHGVLSLALFGKPETKARTFQFGMHVLGFRASGMSERHRFLLTGYRIALGALVTALLFWSGSAALAVGLLCAYPLLRLPVSAGQHIYLAIAAALHRWRQKRSIAEALAACILALYAYVSFVNMIR
jgi:hypothetical protein